VVVEVVGEAHLEKRMQAIKKNCDKAFKHTKRLDQDADNGGYPDNIRSLVTNID